MRLFVYERKLHDRYVCFDPRKFNLSVIEFLAFLLVHRLQVISDYNPPINFRALFGGNISRGTKSDGGCPFSNFVVERKTRKKVTFSSFNFLNRITKQKAK